MLWGIDPASVKRQHALSAHGLTLGERFSCAAGIISPRSGIYKGMSTDALPTARRNPCCDRGTAIRCVWLGIRQ